MLTSEQIEMMIQIADDCGLGVTEKQVSGTRDELAKYGPSMSYSRLTDSVVNGLPVREITGAQAVKGQPRVDLVIVNFGDVRGIVQC